MFATSDVPTIHPIVAAKQATTIDQITNGRFALNIVCGWFVPELEMFGAPIMEHDERYAYATEWLDILKLLWTAEDEFDYDARYFHIKRGFHQPKPIQRPFPVIMNAGGSGVGRHFSAKHCDMIFIHIKGMDIRGRAQRYRRSADDGAQGIRPGKRFIIEAVKARGRLRPPN